MACEIKGPLETIDLQRAVVFPVCGAIEVRHPINYLSSKVTLESGRKHHGSSHR